MISYATLDAWAKFPDFNARFTNLVAEKIAHTRLLVGFHGQSAATTTDPSTNKKGEDVNVGWLKHLENDNPAGYLKEATTGSGEITIGKTGNFKTVEELAYTLKSMIDSKYSHSDLVCFSSSDLVVQNNATLYQKVGTPTEVSAMETYMQSGQTMAGMPLVEIPQMPAKTMLVTSYANLEMYIQTTGLRRSVKRDDEYNCIKNFYSSNECYQLGNPEKATAIHGANVKFV